MIYEIYAFYDLKARNYRTPLPALNMAQAVRATCFLAADTTTEFHRFPADFILTRLGTWNDETGEFGNLAQPERIAAVDKVIAT